jgi:hypothetical protein
VAGRPLRPATDRSLGEPLPHQQANQTQAPLQAHCCFNNCLDVEPLHYAVLAQVSLGYSPPEGRLPTRYSPGRHSTHPRRDFRVRLACVRHAASVDSEPGSNSQSKILCHFQNDLLTSWSLKTRFSRFRRYFALPSFQRSVKPTRSTPNHRSRQAQESPCPTPLNDLDKDYI